MVKMSVSVDGKSLHQIQKFRERLKNAELELLNTPNKTVPDILRLGKLHAKRIAPIDTGALVNAIVSSYKAGGKGRARGVLESRTPNHPLKGKSVAYNVVMHQNPGEKNYRGDPQYMYTTRRYMKNVASDKSKQIVTALRDKLGRFA